MDTILKPILTNAAEWDSACAITLDDIQIGQFLGENDPPGLREHADALCYTQAVTIGDSSLRYQVQANRHSVYREMDAFRLLMVWLFVLFVPICVAIMLFVNRRIVRPVSMLSDASDRIRSGELGVVGSHAWQ